MLRVWIDIETPPQVRYLLPCKTLFERVGLETLVTARDDGATYRLLESEGVEFHAVGRQPGRSRSHKVVGLLRRAQALAALARRQRVDFVLSASRPASVAARLLGLPIFFIGDYEFVNVSVQRATRAFLLFPDVIAPEAWGISPERLIPFRGMKEDLSLGTIALDDYPPHRFSAAPEGVPLILFRPPAEQSHYHRKESTSFSLDLLGYLAMLDSVQVVYAPRYEFQMQALDRHTWRRPPLVLRQPIHTVSLLKAVDLVVSSGGTMLREAAYLGIPACGIFRGPIGGVDRYLESIGRLELIQAPEDFASIEASAAERKPVLNLNPRLGEELLAEIMSRLPRERGRRRGRR